jgi:hypothetical protein
VNAACIGGIERVSLKATRATSDAASPSPPPDSEMSCRSRPAEKCREVPPVTTTARTSWSQLIPVKTLVHSFQKAMFIAFSLSGRFSSTIRTPSPLRVQRSAVRFSR